MTRTRLSEKQASRIDGALIDLRGMVRIVMLVVEDALDPARHPYPGHQGFENYKALLINKETWQAADAAVNRLWSDLIELERALEDDSEGEPA